MTTLDMRGEEVPKVPKGERSTEYVRRLSERGCYRMGSRDEGAKMASKCGKALNGHDEEGGLGGLNLVHVEQMARPASEPATHAAHPPCPPSQTCVTPDTIAYVAIYKNASY